MSDITVVDQYGVVHVWKGDPNATTQIEQWKQSYLSGYTPTVISPRDDNGNYTSDPEKTTTFTILSKEQQALEIANQLKYETEIPFSIYEYLQKTLAPETKHPAPTYLNSSQGESYSYTNRDILGNIKKNTLPLLLALIVIIGGSLYIRRI